MWHPLKLCSSAGPTVKLHCFLSPNDEQIGVCLPALSSGIHFVYPQTVLCCYWWLCGAVCLTLALWSGLVGTKCWCQQGEATLAPVCSVISQTNPTASARNALAPTCVLCDPIRHLGPVVTFTTNVYLNVASLDNIWFHIMLKGSLWKQDTLQWELLFFLSWNHKIGFDAFSYIDL